MRLWWRLGLSGLEECGSLQRLQHRLNLLGRERCNLGGEGLWSDIRQIRQRERWGRLRRYWRRRSVHLRRRGRCGPEGWRWCMHGKLLLLRRRCLYRLRRLRRRYELATDENVDTDEIVARAVSW